ncbi:MAG TPA: SDR family oxidoreductase [Kofleriaceae bacterium]|nr:SDR family oxidoreductase [Kofleriaceae bacterium]
MTTLPDLAGKVALVTGANTGIGKVTALELARAGAHVILACRSVGKAAPVADEIRRETGADRVEVVSLDLASLTSVRACAEELLRRDRPLHILINNAGVAGQRGLTADGFELTFGVNHLGHFLLTQLLIERITASAPARIVNVSSHAHYRVRRIPWEQLREPTRTMTALAEYGVSKLANVLYTAELARRASGSGVTTYALHPGVIASDIWRRVPAPVRVVAKRFMRSPEEGASTSLHCATAPELAGHSGQYYTDCERKQPSRAARDPELAAELWRRSLDWVGLPVGLAV